MDVNQHNAKCLAEAVALLEQADKKINSVLEGSGIFMFSIIAASRKVTEVKDYLKKVKVE